MHVRDGIICQLNLKDPMNILLAQMTKENAVAGKNNYAKSAMYFLSYINVTSYCKNYFNICSVNLTQSEHFFGFDKALERPS